MEGDRSIFGCLSRSLFQVVDFDPAPAMQHAQGPLEPGCTCLACQSQPLGYIHHLLRVGNAQGVRWLAIHNIHHLQALMARLRGAILADAWQTLYLQLSERLPHRLKSPLLSAAEFSP